LAFARIAGIAFCRFAHAYEVIEMKRREFIAGLGGVAAWSLAAHAQPASVPRIGILRVAGPTSDKTVEEMRQGLRDLGHVEGRTFVIEHRWPQDGRLEQMPELAAELVRLRVAVIVANGPQGIQAAKDATKIIPIVMGRMDDADAHGFVTNYSRPDGNITGMSFPGGEITTKWLQVLKGILPQGAYIAALWDAGGTSHQVRLIREAARSTGVDLKLLPVRSPDDFAQAFAAAKEGGAQGLVILGSPVFTNQLVPLAELTVAQQLAAIYYYREFAVAGGLLSYGPTETDPSFSFRRVAYFVAQLLRGVKPGDLPVEQPTRFNLTINRNAANSLGLTIPETLLATADEVIQ
jgi:putative ABC transport system substrate-binding protein